MGMIDMLVSRWWSVARMVNAEFDGDCTSGCGSLVCGQSFDMGEGGQCPSEYLDVRARVNLRVNRLKNAVFLGRIDCVRFPVGVLIQSFCP